MTPIPAAPVRYDPARVTVMPPAQFNPTREQLDAAETQMHQMQEYIDDAGRLLFSERLKLAERAEQYLRTYGLAPNAFGYVCALSALGALKDPKDIKDTEVTK